MSTRTGIGNVPIKRICGAFARSTGFPCRAKKLLRGGRCKLHGGMSTGPRTEQGRLRALANLRYWTPVKAAAKASREQLERQIAWSPGDSRTL
jgi:hypothetical protein